MSRQAETYLRHAFFSYEPPYYLCFDTIKKVSIDFLREWADKVTWDELSKNFVKQIHGEKFYKEIFGNET